MAITLYTSEDVGAPQIEGGVTGELEAIFDACLVNGYGAQIAAGWTKPFTDGLGKAVYQNHQTTGTGTFYRLDNSWNNSAAMLRGYGSMTDVDTGVLAFPTVLQQANGYYIGYNNSTAVLKPRPWLLVADETYCMFLVQGQQDLPWIADQTTNYTMAYYFGDINSYVVGDSTNAVICGNHSSNGWNSSYSDWLSQNDGGINNSIYIRDSLDGLSGSHKSYSSSGQFFSGTRTSGGSSYALPYPSPVTGGLSNSRLLISDFDTVSNTRHARGHLKGLLWVGQDAPLLDFDTFTFEGNSYLVKNIKANSISGQIFLQTSGNAT